MVWNFHLPYIAAVYIQNHILDIYRAYTILWWSTFVYIITWYYIIQTCTAWPSFHSSDLVVNLTWKESWRIPESSPLDTFISALSGEWSTWRCLHWLRTQVYQCLAVYAQGLLQWCEVGAVIDLECPLPRTAFQPGSNPPLFHPPLQWH